MTIDWWTLGLQAVNVLILLWLLQRFLYRPILAIIDRRQAEAAEVLARAEASRQSAEQQGAALTAARLTLDGEREKMLAAAAAEAEKERQRLLTAAAAEAAEQRRRLDQALDEARRGAAAQVQAEAAALALTIARRLLGRLGPPASEPFLIRLADRLDATAPADRPAWLGRAGAEGASSGISAELVLASPADPAALASFQAALDRFAGGPLPCVVRCDPALLGGVELHLPHAVIRDHWAADLDRLAAEVTP